MNALPLCFNVKMKGLIKMTNIVICGANGHMGRVIADVISGREDCKVIAGIDKFTTAYADFPIVASAGELTEKPDVIIDFSHR